MSEAASPTGLSKTSMVVPIANVSSLSQAWIDALGLTRHRPIPTKQKSTVVLPEARSHAQLGARLQRPALPGNSHEQRITRNGLRTNISRPAIARQHIADIEHMRVKKKIASIHPPQPDVFRRSAGRVTIISRRGIVRLLMQRDAGRLRITAVCDPKLVSIIADALYASRVAYAARGVQLQSSTHSEIRS